MTSTLLELIELCCWNNVVVFLDISTCGILSTCSKKLRDSLKRFWLLQCDAIYSRGDPRQKYNKSCPIIAKELVRKAVELKSFSEYSTLLLEAHWCYRSHTWYSTQPSPVQLLPSNELFLEAKSYDFHVRIGYDNGRQSFQKFYPAGSTLYQYVHHEIRFELLPTVTWPGLQRVQQHYDRRDFHLVVDSGCSGTNCLSAAWDSTSVLVVARKLSSANCRPYVVAAASSFAAHREPHTIPIDFANHYPGTNGDPSLPSCTEEFDRYWTFLHPEWNSDPMDLDIDIGLVARETSLVWLVLRIIS